MKVFLVTRRDLPSGQRAAMLCHALREFSEFHGALDREWYESSNTLVLLEVGGKEDLEVLARTGEARGVPCARFHEPDLGGDLASVAFGPSGKGLLKGLPLAFS